MISYVREQSAGSIFRDAYEIYKGNFVTLFSLYFLPVFPFAVLYQYAVLLKDPVISIPAYLAFLLATLLDFPFITVAVSEICLGNKASAMHCFRRGIDRNIGGFLLTYLLLVLVVVLGTILLVIPGLIFMTWYLFTLQVVVVESLYGSKALRRSKNLGKGYYLRNFGILSLLGIVMLTAYLLLALPAGAVVGLIVGFFFPSAIGSWLVNLLYAIIDAAITTILAPFPVIGTVLVYYDMRARKEAYDTTALAEDLMR